MNSSFDLRRLRYFVTVAEFGSVTRAAAELHVAQPAMSLQMRLLEEEFGREIFARGPQGVRLTEFGTQLAEESRALLADVRARRERLLASNSEPQGTVTIGFAQTLGSVLALPLLELAAKRFPRVNLRLREVMSGDIPALIRAESVDFVFSYEIASGAGIQSISLFSEDLFVVGNLQSAGQHFGKADLKEIDFTDLAGVPLYLAARSNAFREEMERVARLKKIKLHVPAEIDSVAVRKDVALSGVGFTILSGSSIAREMREGLIFSARVVRPELRRKICFVRSNKGALSNAPRAIAELIAESLPQIVARHAWPGAIMPVSRKRKPLHLDLQTQDADSVSDPF